MKTVRSFLSSSRTLLLYTVFLCVRPSFRALPSNIALSPSFLEQAVLMADRIEDPQQCWHGRHCPCVTECPYVEFGFIWNLEMVLWFVVRWHGNTRRALVRDNSALR